jgi:hypothetical protein
VRFCEALFTISLQLKLDRLAGPTGWTDWLNRLAKPTA